MNAVEGLQPVVTHNSKDSILIPASVSASMSLSLFEEPFLVHQSKVLLSQALLYQVLSYQLLDLLSGVDLDKEVVRLALGASAELRRVKLEMVKFWDLMENLKSEV